MTSDIIVINFCDFFSDESFIKQTDKLKWPKEKLFS